MAFHAGQKVVCVDNISIRVGFKPQDHYDIPKKRILEIESKCSIVSTKEIVRIINGQLPNNN